MDDPDVSKLAEDAAGAGALLRAEPHGPGELIAPVRSEGGLPLEVVLMSSSDLLDVHSFSGTIYYMAQALKRQFPALEIIRSSRPDATYDLMRTEHVVFWSLDGKTAARAEEDEINSIQRSVHNSFSSSWAAKSAIGHYGARAEDVSVISWGCNFDTVPASEVRPSDFVRDECRLLFIGGEWERKGGDVVCAAGDILAGKGIPLRVDVVGVSPPDDLDPRPWLNHHGYLSKADKEELALLRSLTRDADLLFLPTRRDCTPMVFAEANAYGTPALTRDVGGVGDVVHNGANGIVLPEEADAREFAAAIEALWADPKRYEELRISARREYETRLNWDVWAGKIAELISKLEAAGQI